MPNSSPLMILLVTSLNPDDLNIVSLTRYVDLGQPEAAVFASEVDEGDDPLNLEDAEGKRLPSYR